MQNHLKNIFQNENLDLFVCLTVGFFISVIILIIVKVANYTKERVTFLKSTKFKQIKKNVQPFFRNTKDTYAGI